MTPAPNAVAPYEIGHFESGGLDLSYEVHGHGQRTVVLMHGILLDAHMNRRLASDLAGLGYRVVLLDLPGHGRSEHPRRASFHRMDAYALHVEALLDHLGVERAAVGGVSLGANVALFSAVRAPERIQALVVEMPVLEWAIPAAAMTFVPLLLTVHFARGPARVMASAFRRAPRSGVGPLDSMLNALSSDPVEIAAVLHGILAGPVAPTVAERETITAPTLVIGHRSDRIHPFHDAEQLSRRLPHAQLVEASSILELRMRPERITTEIATFLDRSWAPPSVRRQVGS